MMIESFLTVISYTGRPGTCFQWGDCAIKRQRSRCLVHCLYGRCKHLGSECVRCQETHQVKAAWKERKVYGIKIITWICLGSHRILNNMVLQISSVLSWHLWRTRPILYAHRMYKDWSAFRYRIPFFWLRSKHLFNVVSEATNTAPTAAVGSLRKRVICVKSFLLICSRRWGAWAAATRYCGRADWLDQYAARSQRRTPPSPQSVVFSPGGWMCRHV